MHDPELLTRYNYDEFVPEKFEPWMRFEESPPLGRRAPSFPLWRLDGGERVELRQLWRAYRYLVLEFGSFT
ncbi:MAG: hypothetical protein D6696_15880 [Acidobacteria bacterium]|nr:MAG: hypothetical protein D6696_15880 [Acidobacteriota bacterium]